LPEVSLAVGLAVGLWVSVVSGGEVHQATGIDAGLAVVVPANDAAAMADLTHAGRMLVHGLAADDAARDRVRAALMTRGLYGLATVETWMDAPHLPYADNLVTLLVVDRDALGAKAPPETELMRVVAPYGVLYAKAGGQWKKTVKPRPASFDDWHHFDYGADGNAVSNDTAVRQPTGVQWTSAMQAIPLGGNPAGYDTPGGLRVSGRYAVIDWHERGADKKNQKAYLQCRDAFSGVPLWSIERDMGVNRRRWAFATDSRYVYTWLKSGGELTAVELATGKPALAFRGTVPQGGQGSAAGTLPAATQVRVAGGRLLVNLNQKLLCFDAAAGTRHGNLPCRVPLLWEFAESGQNVFFPCLAAGAGRAFALLSPRPDSQAGRWPFTPDTQAVVCLDLATGRPLWRNTEVKDRPIGQLICADGRLVLFGSAAISGGAAAPFFGTLDAATGRLGPINDNGQRTYNVAYYNALYRDGAVWAAGAFSNLYRFDPATGQMTKAWSISYNQRCPRFTATRDLFILGFVTYLDKHFSGTIQSVARSGCAMGNLPANGMVYLTPSACGCFTMTRGYQALSGEPLRPPLPDAARLVRGSGKPASLPPAPSRSPDGPVADDWVRQVRAAAAETEPATVAGKTLVAVTHQHRVECRDAAGKALWAFVADGRVSQPPVVSGDAVYVGSHDGWVYCLGLSDGGLRWKYFVAPYHRKVVASSQLESSWPVYGVARHEGLIVATAGRHPEIGGGVVAVGLDPKTGAPAWRRTLYKPPAACTIAQGGKASASPVPTSFLNTVPVSRGGKIELPAQDIKPDGPVFAFDPRASDEELRQQLMTVAPKQTKHLAP
jgi:outer membrane protein assembly factor BamB